MKWSILRVGALSAVAVVALAAEPAMAFGFEATCSKSAGQGTQIGTQFSSKGKVRLTVASTNGRNKGTVVAFNESAGVERRLSLGGASRRTQVFSIPRGTYRVKCSSSSDPNAALTGIANGNP